MSHPQKFSLSLLASLFIAAPYAKAEPFDGTFTANQACPLYLSKNNLTNPDNLYSQIGSKYTITEINKKPVQWYRINASLNNSSQNLRWISASCGVSDPEVATTDNNSNNLCQQVSGKADSYVLAVSSQAGFCETFGANKGKPECKALDKDSPYRSQFTLHGLWPNQKSCGTNYGYCNSTQKQTNHCDYAPLTLGLVTEFKLKENMPSYKYGSCLERHEWYKHGTCQDKSPDQYYFIATNMVEEINATTLKTYLSNHLGQTVAKSEIYQQFEQVYGQGSSNKIQLICSQGVLTDIYIQLPNLETSNNLDIKSLLATAPNSTSPDKCSSYIKISDFSAN